MDYEIYKQGVAAGLGFAIGYITDLMKMSPGEVKMIQLYVMQLVTDARMREAWEHEALSKRAGGGE